MKKALCISAVLGVCLCNSSYAVDSTGCGLGSQIFKDQQGIGYQVLAVTTNATSGNQTFAISSGTSGCDPQGRITGGTKKVLGFLENNIDSFALDAAKGSGETIDVIASIANVDSAKAGEIIKDNFDNLFSDENVDVASVSEKVAKLLNIA